MSTTDTPARVLRRHRCDSACAGSSEPGGRLAAVSPPCVDCPCTCTPARSWRCWAPMEPARPPRCSQIAGVLKPIDGEIDVLGSPSDMPVPIRSPGVAWRCCPRTAASSSSSPWRRNLRLHRHRHSEVTEADVIGWFPALEELLDRRTGLLSGGEQQMLALGCKLIADPRLLMVDEMSLGLAPIIVERPAGRWCDASPTRQAPRCCSWNSTCTLRSPSPTGPTC